MNSLRVFPTTSAARSIKSRSVFVNRTLITVSRRRRGSLTGSISRAGFGAACNAAVFIVRTSFPPSAMPPPRHRPPYLHAMCIHSVHTVQWQNCHIVAPNLFLLMLQALIRRLNLGDQPPLVVTLGSQF